MITPKATINSQISLDNYNRAEFFGTLWHYTKTPCRNSAIWVPIPPNYGGIFVGWDTEYQADGDANRILSYQFYAVSKDGSCWSGIHFPSDGKRISLQRFLGSIIQIGLKEEYLVKWPKEVVLCGHFSVADLPGFKLRKSLYRQVDAINRTFVSLEKDIHINCFDSHRNKHQLEVCLRDSRLLAPDSKQSLADVGQMLGLPKIELPDGVIENMQGFLQSDAIGFTEYALRDAEIAACYCKTMQLLHADINDSTSVPPTLSTIALKNLELVWAKLGIDRLAVLGREKVLKSEWNGRYNQKRYCDESIAEVAAFESLATRCYHGGRNEQYLFGSGKRGVWTDYDLCGAYTTALALIGMPQWLDIQQTLDVDQYQPETLGFACCEFEFPEDTRFPCLPVSVEGTGLFYPLRGESFCSSPEIYLARKMGAFVRIKAGIIIPSEYSVYPFAEFVRATTRRRSESKKGSLEEYMWKEIGNATYGKIAQGLRRKRGYSPRRDSYEQLPPSKITNPYLAAYVTSFVRAVLSEILASLPSHVEICNATTDGLLTTATASEMTAATSGPLCTAFAAARYRVSGVREVVAEKHRVAQPLGWRTRGQATLEGLEGFKGVLAKAGLKPPVPKEQHNKWVISQFVQRSGTTTHRVKSLRPLGEICRKGGDLLNKDIVRKVAMDYDFKRKPVGLGVAPILGVDHLRFSTIPWATADDAIFIREKWNDFYKVGRTPLKTLKDYENFDSYFKLSKSGSPIRKPRKNGVRKVAWRMVLRAFTHSLAGLDKRAMSYPDLAQLLTTEGYPTKREDLENAVRASFTPHSVPDTSESRRLLKIVKDIFPTFEEELLLEKSEGTGRNWEIAANPSVQRSISLPVSQPSVSQSEEVCK